MIRFALREVAKHRHCHDSGRMGQKLPRVFSGLDFDRQFENNAAKKYKPR